MDAHPSCRRPILLSLALAALFGCLPGVAQAQAATPAISSSSYAEALGWNGPTGWVQTSEGRFRVLRFGTAKKPHVLRINGRPPADVRSIRFRWDCACSKNAVAQLRDGSTAEFNASWFDHRTAERSWSTYGLSGGGMNVIVSDPRTGDLIQKQFPNLHGVEEITFDPPEQWQSLAAKALRVAPSGESKTVTPREPKKSAQPEVKSNVAPPISVGTRVCHTEHDAIIQESTGIVVGGRPYVREATGLVSFVGFVEGQNADRFQVRVAGMKFTSINGRAKSGRLERFDYNGAHLQVGSILWDDANRWSPCP